MRLVRGVATEPGRPGAENDDFHCEDPALGLFAVASGSAGGWVVSRTAIRALRQYIAETNAGVDAPWPCSLVSSLSFNGNRLRAAVVIASRSVDEARTSPLQLAAVLWSDHKSVAVSSVGDCHVYVARTGRLHRVQPNAVPIRSPSPADAPVVAVCEVEYEPEDRWLICSRGIHTGLPHTEIASVLLDGAMPAPELGPRLIELAATRHPVKATAIVVSPAERRPVKWPSVSESI
jgi:serine/threonine protein phosphatase PrpC